MANVVTTSPWTLDTVGSAGWARSATATVGNANTLSTVQKVWIDHLAIHAGATGVTDILITDGDGGRRIVLVTAPSANEDCWYEVKAWVQDFWIETMPTGCTIEVFLD